MTFETDRVSGLRAGKKKVREIKKSLHAGAEASLAWPHSKNMELSGMRNSSKKT